MKLNKLYKDLYLRFEEEGYETADKKSKNIYKQQKKDEEELLDKIARVILTYTVVDSVLSIGDKNKKTLIKEFNSIVSDICTNEYKIEKNITKDILSTVTKDKYYKDAYVMNIGIDFKLKKLADKRIEKIINKKVDGKIWSKRIWNNKRKLKKQLQDELKKLFDGKTTVNDIEKKIRKKFNENAFNTNRLVESEICKCQNAINNIFAEDHNVEEQMYSATLDNHTCNKCKPYDGKPFKINDPDKPSLPRHSFCRCCYINMPFKDWKPKLRKDNITKEYVPYMTYEEWLKQQNI